MTWVLKIMNMLIRQISTTNQLLLLKLLRSFSNFFFLLFLHQSQTYRFSDTLSIDTRGSAPTDITWPPQIDQTMEIPSSSSRLTRVDLTHLFHESSTIKARTTPRRSAAASFTEPPADLQRPISSPASFTAPATRDATEPMAALRWRRKGWRLLPASAATTRAMRKQARRCWDLSTANHLSSHSIGSTRRLNRASFLLNRDGLVRSS